MANKKKYTLRVGFMREVDADSEADAIYQMGSQMTYSAGFDGARKIMIQSISEQVIPTDARVPVPTIVEPSVEPPPQEAFDPAAFFQSEPKPINTLSVDDIPF
jgi:hypothetical protein